MMLLLLQVGAWVPAEDVVLTPVDGVYVRMGAQDHILSGQSTFYVELSETAALLHQATSRSLVVLDELGRGTATLDGRGENEAWCGREGGRRGELLVENHHILVRMWIFRVT
jgi:DNA mismatch repair protein MSH6